jgi:hypothetical protein
MELDANIEDIEFPDDEQRIQPKKEVVGQETIFYEEDYLSLYSASFDKDLKKLVFELVH